MGSLLSAVQPAPGAAQVATSVSVQSDERFRGRSFSGGNPVAKLNVSYDDPSGVYLGGSATAVLGNDKATGLEGAGLLGQIAYFGYAKRVKSGVAFDAGLTGYRYSRLFSGGREVSYIEAFAGVSKNAVSAYVRFSPRYFNRPFSVVYAEVNATREFAPDWNVMGHVGILAQTSGPTSLGDRRARYDARVGVGRTWGRFEARAESTFGGPGGAYFDDPFGGRTGLVITVSRAF